MWFSSFTSNTNTNQPTLTPPSPSPLTQPLNTPEHFTLSYVALPNIYRINFFILINNFHRKINIAFKQKKTNARNVYELILVQTFISLFNEVNESNDNNTSIILLSH